MHFFASETEHQFCNGCFWISKANYIIVDSDSVTCMLIVSNFYGCRYIVKSYGNVMTCWENMRYSPSLKQDIAF